MPKYDQCSSINYLKFSKIIILIIIIELMLYKSLNIKIKFQNLQILVKWRNMPFILHKIIPNTQQTLFIDVLPK